MELKRLIAEDSKSALQSVRTTYGEDALIVSTNKIGSKTEVICAVDLMPDNEPFIEDNEANPTVNPAQSSADDAAPFSASLNKVMDNKTPPSDTGLADLVANIQQELLELRASVVTHVAANPHELHPEPESGTGASLCERAIRQQYGSLRTVPLNEQRSWEGAHIFFGRPGTGKTTCIENLLAAHSDPTEEARPAFALIALGELTHDHAHEHWLKLAQLSQRYGALCAQAKSFEHLASLIEKLKNGHTILIDSQIECADTLQPLREQQSVQFHHCVGADFAPETAANNPVVGQSTIITRADLACDLNPMFAKLARAQAQITAVSSSVAAISDQD